MKTFFRILSFARPYKRFIPPYFIFALFGAIFSLTLFTFLTPLLNVLFGTVTEDKTPTIPTFSLSINYLKDYFNYYFHTYINESGKLGALKFVCWTIFVSVLLANVFKYLSQKVLTAMRVHLLKNIRQTIFNKITDLHLSYFHNKRKGDLMSVLSNDLQEIENSVISSVQVLFREPIMLIGFFVLLCIISLKLTVFTLILLPISFGLIAEITKRLKRQAAQGQQLLGTILSVIEETISGIRIIKAFNAQKFMQRKFDVQNHQYSRTLKSVINKREMASPLSEFLAVSVLCVIIYYGGKLVLTEADSELTGSSFITYLALFSQVLVPAKNISNAVSNIQRGIVAGDRIFQILDEESNIKEVENAIEIDSLKNNVEFKNVSFAYQKGDVGWALRNINLTIEKGKTVALVGQSGSGKSTLADLLPRFYDPTEGEVCIDGISIKNIRKHSVRNLMGIVTQESILFNDTVFNNIAFGIENVTEEQVITAAKIANADEFIVQMENGYQANIGDRGVKLSGGQRQRLSIARAVLKNPPIMILDEATSALDTESERLVQDALSKLMKNRTSLVIAHRLSTIQHADEIIVMGKGEILERGTHQQLLENNSHYKKLHQLQSFV